MTATTVFDELRDVLAAMKLNEAAVGIDLVVPFIKTLSIETDGFFRRARLEEAS